MFRRQSSASIDFLKFSWFLFATSTFSFLAFKGIYPLDLMKLEIMSKFPKQAVYLSKGQFYKILRNFNLIP